jgi:spore coat polysaccharide biosynthesis predicted glycosyltransferase SpsG
MRTLAVAEAGRDAGMSVTFVSAELPATVEARLKAAGISRQAPGMPLPQSDAILADGYGFSADLMAEWRTRTACLAVMDDNGEHLGARVDLVTNPNPHASMDLYSRWKGPTFLLGSAYAPLRKEFLQTSARESLGDARHILVTMGGSDPLQLTGRVMNGLEGIDRKLEISAVVGGMAAQLDAQSSRHSVTIMRDVADMSAVMRKADMAISAAGSSLWELAHMGVPTVAVIVADNQAAAAHAAAAQGMLLLATPENVVKETGRLLKDPALRRTLSSKARTMVDGLGAKRILEAISHFRRS